MSEGRPIEDRMHNQRNPCMEQEDSDEYGEHCTEKSSSCQTQSNPVDGLYSREEIERLGAGLRSRKCRILNSVLKTIPNHLKAKAQIVCDAYTYTIMSKKIERLSELKKKRERKEREMILLMPKNFKWNRILLSKIETSRSCMPST